MTDSSRAGRFVAQPNQYTAFEPALLPPAPSVDLNDLAAVLSAADLALGRLDGLTSLLPNPDLFVAMYVRQEAVLSSQIEGTQASLTDVLEFEAAGPARGALRDVQEVVNYIAAMNHGLQQTALPLSLRLLREIHGKLMDGVRGGAGNLVPGEFRTSQNWIGAGGLSLAQATYVPPPPRKLVELLGNLEAFLHDESMPPLIHAGISHSQFETIHPFLDGNGRMGRLLITFLLCKRGVLAKPLLYLSHYLKRNRAEYYDRLQTVRTRGAWEEWLRFFLTGVHDVATEAAATAKQILALQGQVSSVLRQEGKGGGTLLRLLDLMFEQPVFTVATVASRLSVTAVTANKLVARMIELRFLAETTGFKRNRKFVFARYLDLFSTAGVPAQPPLPP